LIVLAFISSLKVALTVVLTNAVSELCGGDTAVMLAGGVGVGVGGTSVSEEPQSQPGCTRLIKPSIITDPISNQRPLSGACVCVIRDSFSSAAKPTK
jgi:hypothetical protein